MMRWIVLSLLLIVTGLWRLWTSTSFVGAALLLSAVPVATLAAIGRLRRSRQAGWLWAIAGAWVVAGGLVALAYAWRTPRVSLAALIGLGLYAAACLLILYAAVRVPRIIRGG